uniref:Uncharacterized protein n=1 Tax=Marseillevirus LCMAC101 TaxID=2506602 RepID=A0A481YQM8_9VIRU|nr:MAG: hypothetical protein LCMAC101_00790 [Marseillevirus LCMAC101]
MSNVEEHARNRVGFFQLRERLKNDGYEFELVAVVRGDPVNQNGINYIFIHPMLIKGLMLTGFKEIPLNWNLCGIPIAFWPERIDYDHVYHVIKEYIQPKGSNIKGE